MYKFLKLPEVIKVYFSTRGTVLLLVCLLSASAFANPPPAAYLELDWKDLIPGSWRPPIIQPDPSEHDAHVVDKASLVSALHNQSIKLPGFMKPIVFEENRVSEFLLVPFLEHHVKRHVHHDANQMVYVSLAKPLTVENPFQPLWVMGEIVLESVETDEGPSGYKIINAATAEYVY